MSCCPVRPNPSLMSSEALVSTLRLLECELHDPQVRANRQRLSEVLHPEFHEFGRSGATYNRAQIFELLGGEVSPVQVHSQNFVVHQLALDVCLLTYQSAHVAASGSLERHTNRSSVWKFDSGRWQMVFHQGTPTNAFAQNAT